MNTGAESQFSTAPRTLKYACFFTICLCNMVGGIVIQLPSPALYTFETKYDETEGNIATIQTLILISYTVGALLAGLLVKFIDRQVTAVLATVITAVATVLLPHMPSFALFLVAGWFLGFGVGVFDPLQICWVIDIWRDASGPFILTQHFAYSVGTLVAPLIIEPFLADKVTEDDESGMWTSTPQPSSSTTEKPEIKSGFFIPFAVAGFLMLLGIIAQVILLVLFRRRRGTKSELSPSSTEVPIVSKDVESEYLNRRLYLTILVLSCSFIAFFQATEMGTLGQLATFARYSKLKLSEAEASRVLSAASFGYAGARAAGIFLVLKLAPEYILALNFVLMFLGNTILLALGGSDLTWMYVGSVIVGVGFSTTYPAFYAYIEKYIFVSDGVAGIITTCGGATSAVFPQIVGRSVESIPEIMTYVDYVTICAASVSLVIVFVVTRIHNKKSD